MKKLWLTPLMALTLFMGASALPAKTPIMGTQDSCAASLGIEDANACGSGTGGPFHWVAIASSPPGGYYVGQAVFGPCASFQNGWISLIWYAGYNYTVQCRQG